MIMLRRMSEVEVIAGSPELIAALLARLDLLEAKVVRLEAENAALRARVAELEAELAAERARNGKSPQNSSAPPGSQHPHAKPAPRRKPSGRKPGGQPGHERHVRPLLPVEECTEVVVLVPEVCRGCDAPLAGVDPEPLRHQVWDMPEVRPTVVEYQRHRLQCECGAVTCAPLPDGVPEGQSGPKLVAFCATMSGEHRVSRRQIAGLVEEVLHIPCSPGHVVKMQRTASKALEPAYEEAAAALPALPFVNADETPTKEGKTKAWLWVFAAPDFAVYRVADSRRGETAAWMLGPDFAGAVGCDRAKMYLQFDSLQWCWAHLLRDFQSLIDGGNGVQKRLGFDLKREADEMFRLWRKVRDGTSTREAFSEAMEPVRRRVEEYLLRGKYSGDRRLHGFCKGLYDRREALWTFIDVEGVEPTNNEAERSLRKGVLWRKVSHGSKSEAGSRFVERMLTVVETCRRQAKSAYAYVVEAVSAAFAGRTCPQLIAGA